MLPKVICQCSNTPLIPKLGDDRFIFACSCITSNEVSPNTYIGYNLNHELIFYNIIYLIENKIYRIHSYSGIYKNLPNKFTELFKLKNLNEDLFLVESRCLFHINKFTHVDENNIYESIINILKRLVKIQIFK